jgi:two-component system chemotaxis sensor kinase CheA
MDPMDEIAAAVLRVFLPEATAMAERLREQLVSVAQDPGAPGPLAAFERTAHGLKGAAVTVDLEATAAVARQLERLAGMLRAAPREPPGEALRRMQQGVEAIQRSLVVVAQGGSEPTELHQARSLLQAWPGSQDQG